MNGPDKKVRRKTQKSVLVLASNLQQNVCKPCVVRRQRLWTNYCSCKSDKAKTRDYILLVVPNKANDKSLWLQEARVNTSHRLGLFRSLRRSTPDGGQFDSNVMRINRIQVCEQCIESNGRPSSVHRIQMHNNNNR